MQEKRKQKRNNLIYYLRVFAEGQREPFGYLVDISREGARVVREKPVQLGASYHLRIRLPEEIDGMGEITSDVRSVWCRKDRNPEFYAAGFRLEGVGSPASRVIDRLIEDYGFRA